MKTGSGPTPTPVTIPEFVIEYEETDPTVKECSFTVINEGLYFLAQVGYSDSTGRIDIDSTDGQIWYTRTGSESTNGVVCAFATLYPGDTVTYFTNGGATYLGLVHHAIRILNAQFDSVTSIDIQFNQTTSNYDILNINEPIFIYFGGSYDHYSASDSSSINGSVCDTYAKIADDRSSVSRVVTCCDAEDGGTISASGASYTRTLFLIAKLVNVSPVPTTSEPYLVSQQGAKIELPVYGDEDLVIQFKMKRFNIYTPGNVSYSCVLGDHFDGDGVLLFYNSSGEWQFFCGTGCNTYWTATYNDIIDVEIDTVNGRLTIDNTIIYEHTPGTRTHNPICLFTNSQFNYHFIGAIGEVTIYKDNDLFAKLMPMKDGSTGEGYYHDIIGNQDYYSTTSNKLTYANFNSN
jgi:hypothetical protein